MSVSCGCLACRKTVYYRSPTDPALVSRYSPGTQLNICNKPHIFCRICKTVGQVGDQSACVDCSPTSLRNYMQSNFEHDFGDTYDDGYDWALLIKGSKDSRDFYDVWHGA